MATFLFWNINRKPLDDAVHRLAERHQVDVLMLAECPLTAGAMLLSLNRNGGSWEFAAPINPLNDSRIQIYVRSMSEHIEERFAFPHSTVRELIWPGLPTVLLAVVHLPSKLRANPDSQFSECVELGRQLREAEDFAGHRRTLVVGDFNVNPFEPGMLAANALNCESSRALVAKGERIVAGRAYRFFYNPMWNFFGDSGSHPGGTYFHRSSQMVRVSWNIFDQVLVRPDLLYSFNTSQLQIITGDGNNSFLTRAGTPTLPNNSDHLPILFKLNLF